MQCLCAFNMHQCNPIYLLTMVPLKVLSYGGKSSRVLRGGTNMICIQSFVTERAVDFITILEQDFFRQYY